MSKAYLAALGLLLAAIQLRADLCGFVDPFVGTTATGHTTPAAAYPFGMVQAGPTTGTISWQYCSGYRYEDTAVTGYALTALSGTGFCEYNELQVLPFSGDVRKLPMTSAIDKTTEKAEPGYYAVHQSQDGVNVEIAAAKHAAIYLFRWDKGGQTKVLVNLPYGNGQRDGNQLAGSHDGKVTRLGDRRRSASPEKRVFDKFSRRRATEPPFVNSYVGLREREVHDPRGAERHSRTLHV